MVSRGKIKIYIGCILCFSFVWNFPKWFALGWVEGQNLPEQTDLAKSYSYDKIYLVWLEKVVLEFFIPLATLTVLNILLLKMVSIIFTEFQNFKAFFIYYIPPHTEGEIKCILFIAYLDVPGDPRGVKRCTIIH